MRIGKYFGNLWHAIRGTPHYVPSRHDVQRITLEADTSEAMAAIELLQAKIDKLRGSIEAANDELGLIGITPSPGDDER